MRTHHFWTLCPRRFRFFSGSFGEVANHGQGRETRLDTGGGSPASSGGRRERRLAVGRRPAGLEASGLGSERDCDRACKSAAEFS